MLKLCAISCKIKKICFSKACHIVHTLDINYYFQSFDNYHGLLPGDSALFLNGLSLDLEVVDIFTIHDVLTDELYIMEGLWSLGLRVGITRWGGGG